MDWALIGVVAGGYELCKALCARRNGGRYPRGAFSTSLLQVVPPEDICNYMNSLQLASSSQA